MHSTQALRAQPPTSINPATAATHTVAASMQPPPSLVHPPSSPLPSSVLQHPSLLSSQHPLTPLFTAASSIDPGSVASTSINPATVSAATHTVAASTQPLYPSSVGPSVHPSLLAVKHPRPSLLSSQDLRALSTPALLGMLLRLRRGDKGLDGKTASRIFAPLRSAVIEVGPQVGARTGIEPRTNPPALNPM